ncbi:MAG TPA: hypothetical protein VE420_08480, partial [Gemmatimonadales bacterium]|nr:hypothetical protein [Gemmatimonadales bacterium]
MARDNGTPSSDRWENLRRHQATGRGDVGKTERLISGVAGAALLLLTFRARRLRPFLFPVATGLIAKALKGQAGKAARAGAGSRGGDRTSPVASVGRGEGIKLEESVTINRPVLEVYRFWR